MSFYTKALARRMGLTPIEVYDQLFKAGKGIGPVSLLADWYYHYALQEVRDMATAARALIHNPKLEEQCAARNAITKLTT